MNRLTLKHSRVTEIAYPNRLKGWHKKQKQLEYPIYYLLPSKKWLRIARLRQPGLAFATFDDLAKLILEQSSKSYVEMTEHQRNIFMQEIMLRKSSTTSREERKHEALAFANTYGQLKRLGYTLEQLPTKFDFLRHVLEEYENKWTKEGFLDPESLILEAAAEARSGMKLPIGHLVIDGFFDLSALQYQILQTMVDLNVPITFYLPDIPKAQMIQDTHDHLSKLGFVMNEVGPRSVMKLKEQKVYKATSIEEEINGVLDILVEKSEETGWEPFGVILVNEKDYLENFLRIARNRGIPLKQPHYVSFEDTQLSRLLKLVLSRDYSRSNHWEQVEVLDSLMRLVFVSPQEFVDWKGRFLSKENCLPEEISLLFEAFIRLRSTFRDEMALADYIVHILEFLKEKRLVSHWKRRLVAEETTLLKTVSVEWKAYDQLLRMLEFKCKEIRDSKIGSVNVYFETFVEWFFELQKNLLVFQERTPIDGLTLYTLRDVALFSGGELFALGMDELSFPGTHQLQGYFQETDLEYFSFPYAVPNRATYLKKQEALYHQLAFLSPFINISYVVGVDQENPLLPSKFIKYRKVRVSHWMAYKRRRLRVESTRKARKAALLSTVSHFTRRKNEHFIYYNSRDKDKKWAYHYGLQYRVDQNTLPAHLREMKENIQRLALGNEPLEEKWKKQLFSEKVAVTALESYAACPFRYAMERVLSVPEAAEWSKEMDAREKGSLLHQLIQRFYTESGLAGKAFGIYHEQALAKNAEEYLHRIFEAIWQEAQEHYSELSLVELKKQKEQWLRTIRKWWSAERYHFWDNANLKDMKISDFERKIQLVLRFDDEMKMTIEGKIDRLDQDEDGFVIYDYKSGKASMNINKEVRLGLKLQIPLYILAVQEELIDRRPYGASYISLREPAKRARNGLWDHETGTRFNLSRQAQKVKALDGYAFMDEHNLKEKIRDLWVGMHSDFSVKPLDCSPWCSYKMVCRVTKTQLEEAEERG
ncbi:PD-(D/E)XK nuclease family protein [Ammoniphilus sp. CFH 90114]|uniref:PD-(D/E)XK nuclease family protein n=1 Tax=Ammoniphilus sp. CFH 90114 TaxID=2493665 RepID=UPI00100DC395|nr:PD-(D/E)XK nuclease family protein [Ammoniphilus sp. CFH 90114]RXT15385.1 hypothetical protein EIZ39_04070 [Ammoniphilus sp. CFH 90114]